MTFTVELLNAAGGDLSLGIDPARYLRAQINSVNRTARWAKRVLMVEPFSKATGVRRVIFNDRIRVQTATTNRPEAQIIPSSRGIPARNFKHRGVRVDGSGLRARILVAWWRGEKVAAGFINPHSRRALPLATRSVRERNVGAGARNPSLRQYRYDYEVPRDALGPSAAALFREAVNDSTREQVANRLAEEFNHDLDKELF